MKKIRIYLADDHSILREGLKLILNSEEGFEVVGESGDGKEAMEQIESIKPDIAVLDISMPTMSGIEIARWVKKYIPETKILVLSRHDNEEYVKQLLSYGVSGYVLKDNAGDDLIRAIEEIEKGNIYLSPKIATGLVTDYLQLGSSNVNPDEKSPFAVLSSREREVIKLIAEGYSNNEIGEKLRISGKTVKTHRANIMKKLGVHKTADLVSYAIKHGFVEI